MAKKNAKNETPETVETITETPAPKKPRAPRKAKNTATNPATVDTNAASPAPAPEPQPEPTDAPVVVEETAKPKRRVLGLGVAIRKMSGITPQEQAWIDAVTPHGITLTPRPARTQWQITGNWPDGYDLGFADGTVVKIMWLREVAPMVALKTGITVEAAKRAPKATATDDAPAVEQPLVGEVIGVQEGSALDLEQKAAAKKARTPKQATRDRAREVIEKAREAGRSRAKKGARVA